MSDKHLSGEEKRARMKKQFKEELRKRKEFMDRVKRLRHTQNINKALSDMQVEDDSQKWIDRLNQETAFNEAKTELALEQAAANEAKAQQEADFRMSEAEMQKLAAEEMVKRMKAELANENASGTTTSPTSEDSQESGGGGLLNVELSPEGDAMDTKAEEVPVNNKPNRKMMLDMIAEIEGEEAAASLEAEAPAPESKESAEGSSEEAS